MSTEASVAAVDGKRPTILEVARLAGVSHQTVSRYFRAQDGLKPETKARVEAAVRELNYRPNLIARSMRTRKSGRLAVVVPTLAYNPARMLAGASAVARDAGYVVDVLSIEGGVESRTGRLLDIIDLGQFEGVLSFAPILPSAAKEIARGATIAVSADFDDAMRGIGELADGSAVGELIERLAAQGHRRFFHVAGDQQFASARGRKQVYLDTIERLGLESTGVHDGDWSGESGMAAVAGMSEDHPTAIIAANDLVATGVLKAAHERGWRVPDDLSVTGWDDGPSSRFLIPSLTTVDINLEQVGGNAMARLLGELGAPSAGLAQEPLTRIVWRDSTAAAPSD
ncbi:MAG: LacI family DNA-binding transcriptional regulator [Microbacterium sp.]